ncbi:MAG TPA: ATP-binding cassette domain-containing protein [Acholeplasma sp.]|nr:ATP-binding cassette domain-containing protein [Acholeplasma sp.]
MIKLENINKSFPINGNETHVLTNINFEISKGDIFGIVGKTGAGKSTLLRLINGFIAPDSGEIIFKGKNLNKASRKSLIKYTSMIFQNYNLLNNLNVIENVLLPVKLHKLNDVDYNKRAIDLLNFVGLSDFKRSNVSTLSGGQKQRVAIARALITKPDIIFCDEPTSALDDETSFEVLKLLKTINEKYSTTIVIVSHNINIINMMCNRIAIIEDGMVSNIISKKPEKLEFKTYQEVLVNNE